MLERAREVVSTHVGPDLLCELCVCVWGGVGVRVRYYAMRYTHDRPTVGATHSCRLPFYAKRLQPAEW